MTKIISLLLIFCLPFFHSQSSKIFNKIDSLNSAEDIQNFISNENNKINYYLKIEDKINYDRYCNVIADSLKTNQNWGKGDFDKNGLTDLIVIGNTSDGPETIYILDKGDHFDSKKLSMGNLYEACSFSSVKNDKIEYLSVKILNRYGFLSKLIKENFVYKYDDFIEENLNPKRHNILEIIYEETGSHWNRNPLKIKVISNRDITWTKGNSENFQSKVSEKKFNEIIELLNYIDFENLENEYEVGYSDSSTNYLTITYDNLKVKKIRDYGGMGTRGLRKFYNVLLDLKNLNINKNDHRKPTISFHERFK